MNPDFQKQLIDVKQEKMWRAVKASGAPREHHGAISPIP
jgi:hypothetical protein